LDLETYIIPGEKQTNKLKERTSATITKNPSTPPCVAGGCMQNKKRLGPVVISNFPAGGFNSEYMRRGHGREKEEFKRFPISNLMSLS
jgi:hypothetical protein